jgi:hypothetical protein
MDMKVWDFVETATHTHTHTHTHTLERAFRILTRKKGFRRYCSLEIIFLIIYNIKEAATYVMSISIFFKDTKSK